MTYRKSAILALLVLLPGMTAAVSFSDRIAQDAVPDQESQETNDFKQSLEKRIENRSEADTGNVEEKVKQRLREKTEEMKHREEVSSLEKDRDKRGFLSALFSIF